MCNTSYRGSATIQSTARVALHCITWLALLFSGNALGAVHYYYGDLSVPLGYDQPVDLNFENDDFDDVIFENFVYAEGNYQGLYMPYSPAKSSASTPQAWNTSPPLPTEQPSTRLRSPRPITTGRCRMVLSIRRRSSLRPRTPSSDSPSGRADQPALRVGPRFGRQCRGHPVHQGLGFRGPAGRRHHGGRSGHAADLRRPQRRSQRRHRRPHVVATGLPEHLQHLRFLEVQDNFGAGSGLPSQAQVTTVPEPSALLLLLILGVPVASRRRR